MTQPDKGSTIRRMFVEGEWSDAHESPRMALARMMAELDKTAAEAGMVVTGDVEIAVSPSSLFAVPRRMRIEADVVTR